MIFNKLFFVLVLVQQALLGRAQDDEGHPSLRRLDHPKFQLFETTNPEDGIFITTEETTDPTILNLNTGMKFSISCPTNYFNGPVEIGLKSLPTLALIRSRIENSSPFCLGGDSGGVFAPVPELVKPGNYQVYCKNDNLVLSANFQVTINPFVTGFNLLDATSNVVIGTSDFYIQQSCSKDLSIEAVAANAAKKVILKLYQLDINYSNPILKVSRSESSVPYTLGGDVPNDFYSVPALKVPGNYKIEAKACVSTSTLEANCGPDVNTWTFTVKACTA